MFIKLGQGPNIRSSQGIVPAELPERLSGSVIVSSQGSFVLYSIKVCDETTPTLIPATYWRGSAWCFVFLDVAHRLGSLGDGCLWIVLFIIAWISGISYIYIAGPLIKSPSSGTSSSIFLLNLPMWSLWRSQAEGISSWVKRAAACRRRSPFYPQGVADCDAVCTEGVGTPSTERRAH